MPAPDPLVLLPGLLNDGDLWADQIAALSGTVTCQVGVITQGETLPEIARSVLDAAPRYFALAGFSLGGYVAQEILRTAPERVTRLALFDTSIRPDTPERTALRRKLEQAATAPGKFHGFGEHLLATYLAPTNHANDAASGARFGLELADEIDHLTARTANRRGRAQPANLNDSYAKPQRDTGDNASDRLGPG